jgi:hypothetical protein
MATANARANRTASPQWRCPLSNPRLLGAEPVAADAHVNSKRLVELEGGAHLAPHELARRLRFGGGALEKELVVDLEHQVVLRSDSFGAWWASTIAILMMSAEVPWIDMLTASRSPWPRTCGRSERREQAVAARGDETGTDRAAHLGADRDVLEVGVGDPARVIFADRSKSVIFEPIPSSSS